MRPRLHAIVVIAVASCASSGSFHEGPTGLEPREQRALLAARRMRPDGFERFWLRPDCRIGLVKWSVDSSKTVEGAPPELLDLIRDEVGRINRDARTGETVFVSVVVFEWERRFFGRAPRVGYETVGRDRAGQIIWMGQDRVSVPRELAVNLAESDALLVARGIGQKLKKELGR